MAGGTAGRGYRAELLRGRLGPHAQRELVLLAGGLIAFVLVPGPAGPVLALGLLAALAAASPYLGLLALVSALPLHFLLRRDLGPLALSLPDTVLLACVLGLLGALYWRGLLLGSRGLRPAALRAYRGPYFWPALLLLAAGTAAMVLSPPERRTEVQVGFRAYSLLVEPLAVYALVLLSVRDRGRLWLLIDVLFAGAVLVSGYGVIEAVAVALNRSAEVGGYFRADSVFNHPNTLALYLSRMLPLFGGLAVLMPGRGRRAAYAAGAAVMGVAMLLSGSRGGWIAVAAAVVPVAVLGRSRRWILPAAGMAAGGVVLLALTGQNRLPGLLEPGRGSVDTRGRLWRAALETISESPVRGSGLSRLTWMRRYIPARRLEGAELIDAHNLFLDFWAKLGIFGLAAILWLVARFFLVALRAHRRTTGETRALAAALVAAMTAAFVHGLVDAFYFGLPFAVFFWLFLGLAEVLDAGADDMAGPRPETPVSPAIP